MCCVSSAIKSEALKDNKFGQSILIADHLLSIEDKNFLIKLMNNLIKTK